MPNSNYRELQEVYNEWVDSLVEEAPENGPILNKIYEEKNKAFQKIEGMNLREDEMWRRKAQWLRDDIRRMKRLRADQEVDMDAIIRELDDKTRNPRRRAANPRNEKAFAKKEQEAIKRLGGIDNYRKAMDNAMVSGDRNFRKWQDREGRNDKGWNELYTELNRAFDNGEIDVIEYYLLEEKWLLDDMRRMDRERREKADQEVDMDAMIREIDDKTRI